MAIKDDGELKNVKRRIAQLKNAIIMFDYADFPSDIVAEKKKKDWEAELEKLENQVEEYSHAR